jgi:hypothetical protein
LLDLIAEASSGYSTGDEEVMVVVEALLITAALVVGGVLGLALVARFLSARS